MSSKMNSIPDPNCYNISIRKTFDEGQWLFHAKVKEFPDVGTWGNTFAEAYESAIDAITDLIALACELDKPYPQPYIDQAASEENSGRFTVRLPKSLHARLNENADIEGVSLNQYIVAVLSFAATLPQQYFSTGKPVPDRTICKRTVEDVTIVSAFKCENNLHFAESGEPSFVQSHWLKTTHRNIKLPTENDEVILYENSDRLRELNIGSPKARSENFSGGRR